MNLTVMHDGSERIAYDDPRIPIYVRKGDLKSMSNMAALCHWHEDVELLMLKRMLEYVRTHYTERIRVDDIAAAGSVCRAKGCQIFKQYLNRSPNDYVTSFRLEKGAELLKGTDLSITEIAGSCGFSGASYFTELFTRYKGITPTAYRKGGIP